MKGRRFFHILLLIVLTSVAVGQAEEKNITQEKLLLKSMHSISSHKLFGYVKELTSDKYAGRLTGTDEYRASAEWVASLLETWGIAPAGDKGTYFQAFPNPYTLVFENCQAYLHIPYKGSLIKKHYRFEDEFIPGSTSGSGEITAEVIYVGYGITAPELNFDEYKGMDVKGKIVMMEREVPVSPDKDPELFKKWRPYSFHQYKLENAVAHGARGMLYNYGPIANPNNSYSKDFIYSHVGSEVVKDIFSGTGRKHTETVEKIRKTLKPRSFATGKVFTLKNQTEYHPEGVGYNVIGILEGTDPVLKNEVIILGGHLDHVGRCYEIMPGANDNASGVSVILGVAEAMASFPVKPRRSVMFLFFGAEEQGIAGSKYYLDNPVFPLERTVALIYLDGVGCGDELRALAAKNYPRFWKFFNNANQKYIHRSIKSPYFANIARPRLDAARFMWQGVPTISFSAFGSPSSYHNTKDNADSITPEILEDLAQLVFISILDMANQDSLNFRKK